MNNVMLDLETMGAGPDAAIIAVGAVMFDFDTGKLGKEFYKVVDLQAAVDTGGVIDPAMVLWWMKQSDKARTAFERKGELMSIVLHDFTAWIGDVQAVVWGNGAAFDNVLLASTYRRLKLAPPWKFWNDRCYRTLAGLRFDIDRARQGTHHNALDDAKTQAEHAIKVWKALHNSSGEVSFDL